VVLFIIIIIIILLVGYYYVCMHCTYIIILWNLPSRLHENYRILLCTNTYYRQTSCHTVLCTE